MDSPDHESNLTITDYSDCGLLVNIPGTYSYNHKTGALKIRSDRDGTVSYYRIKIINNNKIQVYQKGVGTSFYARKGSPEDRYSKIFAKRMARHEKAHR
jgi:hypothetical protein